MYLTDASTEMLGDGGLDLEVPCNKERKGRDDSAHWDESHVDHADQE